MAHGLQIGLRNGGLRRGGLRAGFEGGSIFNIASLDLNFARYKNIGSLVTFTRASSGTFVGSDGVLRTAVTNLLLRSEEFNDAGAWAKVGTTVSANSITSPNGALTADTLVEDTSTGTHRCVAAPTIANTTVCTVSVYAKAAGRTHMRLSVSGGLAGELTANLSNGTVAASSGATNPTVQSVGDGWYRVSFTTAASTSTSAQVGLSCIQGTNTSSYTGDGTSGIYLWGAQLEQSTTVGEYIPTTSAINSAPRFDHNPTTGESLGLLVEEARTNSVTNNTMVGAVAGTPGTNPTGWPFATAQSNGLTISIVGTGVENGINYIDYRFNGTTVASPNACAFGFTNAAAATSQTWTSSLYWKLASGTTTGTTNWQLGIIENTAVGTFVTGAFYTQTTPTSAALITQRPTATRTLSGGVTVGQVGHTMNIPVTGNTAIDFTIRIGLPQLELGAFATSPILTSTAAATRSADVASITGTNFSSWYNQTEGTVFTEASAPSLNANIYGISNNTGSERILLDTGTNTKRFIVTDDGTAQATISRAYTYGTMTKTGTAFALNSFQIADSGLLGTEDTVGTMPSVDRLNIGANATGVLPINGTIKRLTYWPTRLANTTLQSITQ